MDGLGMIAEAPLGEAVFRPNADAVAGSRLTAFARWCETETGRRFPDHGAFDRFSVEEFREFWRLFLRWSGLPWEGASDPVCVGDSCENARFFPALRLSYAECLLGGAPDLPAITACHADGRRDRLTRGDLRARVAGSAASLGRLGVGPGDRVVAVARNGAETVIAALAAATVGASFSACAPDMGTAAMLARFAPLEPVVLFGTFRPEPWDSGVPVADRVAELAAGLPSLAAIVALDDGPMPPPPAGVTAHGLAELARGGAGHDAPRHDAPRDGAPQDGAWSRRPFDHPLFVLFSSGTTGAPKCIVHGAGGTLLEHVKEHRLHCDLKGGDKLLFQTSCGWMMWNWQLSALASGAELVLYDGPLEGPQTFWKLVAEERVTVFGTNPAHLQFCEEAGFSPNEAFDLSALRAVLSTGSVLQPRRYDWVRGHVGAVALQSISGGSDIIGCFVLGTPNLPVHRGEAQCRSLGLDVRALPPRDDPGACIGELVCANPFPSRPVGFYGDADGARFHGAYFAANPGMWTHGDLIEATPRGGWRLHGRSDGVLNARGIRIGSAEIYRILDDIPEIAEAMAVEQSAEDEAGGTRMVLLVVPRAGVTLDGALTNRIRSDLARRGSPAHVPACVAAVEALPVTLGGKRSEAAARDAVNGRPARNRDALRNPECLAAIADHPALRDDDAARPPRGRRTAGGPAPRGEGLRGEGLRHEVQAICEDVLGVSPIGPSDNLLALGADSLAILKMLLAVEEHVGASALPLSVLLSAPTIEGLTAFLSGTETHAADGPAGDVTAADGRPDPHVRPVAAADVGPVCRLLEDGFAGSGIGAAAWARLFDHAWSDGMHDRGFVLTVGDEIVGFLGTIFARRRAGDRVGLVGNYTSWYVRPEYRGWGMALLAASVRDEERTYTAFTPGTAAWASFEALGFTRRNRCEIFMPPLWHTATLRGTKRPSISFDPAVIRRVLDDEQRRVFDDHAPYDCLQLVVRDGPDHAHLVVKRRLWDAPRRLKRFFPSGIPYSDVLHCSAPPVLARHLERVKLAVLRRQRTAALAADARWFPERPKGLPNVKRMCLRSPVFDTDDLDRLYSEYVLLPI